MKKIVIIGGGYGGMYAGKLLHKKFKKNDDVSITLIDKKPYHTLMTELHEVAGHRTPEDAIKVDLKKIFAKRKVDVVLDEVTGIDFNSQTLTLKSNETCDYDYLIVGAGSEPCFYGIEGVQENSHTLWSYEDAVALREHIKDMFRQAVKEKDPEKRKELLTFVVAGAGFTGVEMVGELGEWKEKLCSEYNVDPSEVNLYLIDALPTILPILPEKLIAKSLVRLKKLGIEVLTGSCISSVTPNAVNIGNDLTIPSKTVIWTAGVQGSKFASNLGLTLGKRGRVQVNEYMQSVDYNNVYLVGDNAYYEEEGAAVPQIVEAAHQTAETAVHNIHADITDGEKETYESNFHGFMVSIGGRYAVANLGGKKPMAMSGFFAMLMKHMINMLYLFKIAGVNRTWSYMMHEFFHIKDRRSFVGGYFAKASPNFWLVPFRMYLGIMWLIEGLNKIDEGWLDEAKMVASDAVSAASGAAEAVTAASGAAEGGAEAAAQYGEPLIKTVPAFMQWIIDNIVAPNAIPFQTGMIAMEIILGVCLIVGLFTFMFSGISIVLVIGITLTGMSDASILWYFFGGIAMLGGSGSTFGLDYYVLPWLKKQWKKIGIVRKSYLYFD